MYNFRNLEELYESISSVEKILEEFDECACYELDGGISVWCETHRVISDNIAKQKRLLKDIRDNGFGITPAQRMKMQSWDLDIDQ